MVSEQEINDLLRPILLKDLRIQCRARGLTPAGGKEALSERLKEHMLETGDMTLYTEFNGEITTSLPSSGSVGGVGLPSNNYVRPGGQNCDNFLTDRPSSRVLAPPGGGSQFTLGDDPTPAPAHTARATVTVNPAPPKVDTFGNASDMTGNNYTRPAGQNVGNFIGDRPSSRVLAPPGGGSQISFG